MKVVKLNDIENELNVRMTDTMRSALAYLSGDHFQNGDGYVPARIADSATRSASVSQWQNAFVSEDTIGKIVSNEQNGFLGREPDWQAITDDETLKEEIEANLTSYWNEREMLSLFREAHEIAAACGKVVFRAYVPSALQNNGKIPKMPDLLSAMKLIHFEVLNPDQAGVFLQSETYRPFGVFKTTDDEKNVYEVTTTDDNGLTILTRLETTEWQKLAEETIKTFAAYMPKDKTSEVRFPAYDLNGTLFYFEVEHDALVTESVQSNQRQVNFNHTAKSRSTFQGGFRDIIAMNADEPVDENENPVPVTLGGGNVNLLNGVPVYKETSNGTDKELVGYANPNIQVVEPVDPENFIKSEDSENAAIYRQACQEHLVISESATVSGRSKKESRDAFEKLLKNRKAKYDSAGRFVLTLLTKLSAIWTNQEKRFESIRFDFNCHVDAGSLEPEEITALQTDHKEGRISTETYLGKIGIEDVDAEIERLTSSPEAVKKAWLNKIELAESAKGANLPPEFIVESILMIEDENEKNAWLTALNTIVEPNPQDLVLNQ